MDGTSKHPLADNPLRTRADLQAAFAQLTDPLKPYYSEGGARLLLGATGASYAPEVAQMEGFSRVLWGLVPLIAGGGSDAELEAIYRRGIDSGTDPLHPEYWGAVQDYDQRLVEMAAFGYALAMAPERLWHPLPQAVKDRLYAWLGQINAHPVYDCNWLFFQILVNVGFRKLGLAYEAEQTERNLDRVEQFYMDEGWYADGAGGHSDYYVPFAIHYYGLLYAKLMNEEDPARASRFRERARTFAGGFAHWFAADGPALPYGRSMAYRFSQGALWGALALADEEALPYGVLKGLLLRHLRWWFKQPIFGPDGVLTIGYAYPNLVMAENYNAPGSPYWACKAFAPLALPEDHPFWTAEEQPLSELPPVSVQQAPHLVLCRSADGGHVAAFNAGHLSTNEHTHTSAKYEKFVYSTAFGFSVPRAEWGLSQGAFDSMLALSEGDNLYRVRRKNEETRIDGDILFARWKPWADVEVRTWIVAGLPWHLRLHRVETARRLDAAEGGFALKLERGVTHASGEGGVFAAGPAGASGVYDLLGAGREPELVQAQANTNLLHPRTVIPMLRCVLEPGVHWLLSAAAGTTGAEATRAFDPAGWRTRFEVRATDEEIRIGTPLGKSLEIGRH
ncbi:DUF2264 domain-containing protein [Cohnella sp. 56]|uniref:DUF2264 domain-containing protein n=1 Tax=Cohnella sp. 56 TaxID=3113722 RepID=UPI0030EB0617